MRLDAGWLLGDTAVPAGMIGRAQSFDGGSDVGALGRSDVGALRPQGSCRTERCIYISAAGHGHPRCAPWTSAASPPSELRAVTCKTMQCIAPSLLAPSRLQAVRPEYALSFSSNLHIYIPPRSFPPLSLPATCSPSMASGPPTKTATTQTTATRHGSSTKMRVLAAAGFSYCCDTVVVLRRPAASVISVLLPGR